jgi:putative tryptophan/tyrosine transport system substrate-binding protein
VAARGAGAAAGADAAHRRADGRPRGLRIGAFLQELAILGWTDGRNVRIEYRWSEGDAERIRKYAAELVALAPDLICASGSATVGPLLQATRTIPIVFVQVPDPVGAAFVDSLARPGGNVTGVSSMSGEIGAKRLGLLQELVSRAARFAVVVNSNPLAEAFVADLRPAQQTATPIGNRRIAAHTAYETAQLRASLMPSQRIEAHDHGTPM